LQERIQEEGCGALPKLSLHAPILPVEPSVRICEFMNKKGTEAFHFDHHVPYLLEQAEMQLSYISLQPSDE